MADFALVKHLDKKHRDIFKLFYSTMEGYLKNRKNAKMTDHELLHIRNVFFNADCLVKRKYFQLNKDDFYYLCLSICVHDLAMNNIYNKREKHHKKVSEVLKAILERNEALRSNILDDDILIICNIAEAHSGDPQAAYEKLKNEERHKNINILSDAMLLRISDELDITQKRIEGYPLKTYISDLGKGNKIHWLKHASIASWEILQNNRTCITLFLVPDILDKVIPNDCPDIRREEYIKFMKSILLKLKNELEVLFENCNRESIPWNLKNLNLRSHDDTIATQNSDYINELNQYLSNNKYSDENRKHEKSTYETDLDIRAKRKRKNKYPPSKKKGKYTIIGEDKYRKSLDEYIKKMSMLRQGCYIHRTFKILTWLDSFGFHQNIALLQESSKIIAEHIKKHNVDIIIGLGLKGSRIATVVGLKLNKPVAFFVSDELNIYNVNSEKKYNIAMITDCIITGRTAISCTEKLSKKGDFNIIGVYSVFIRNSTKENNRKNQLMKKGIAIYSINDTYTYNLCSFKKQEDCPLYNAYGEKNYERSYKWGKENI